MVVSFENSSTESFLVTTKDTRFYGSSSRVLWEKESKAVPYRGGES